MQIYFGETTHLTHIVPPSHREAPFLGFLELPGKGFLTSVGWLFGSDSIRKKFGEETNMFWLFREASPEDVWTFRSTAEKKHHDFSFPVQAGCNRKESQWIHRHSNFLGTYINGWCADDTMLPVHNYLWPVDPRIAGAWHTTREILTDHEAIHVMDEDSEQPHLVARCWRCRKDAAESRAQHGGTNFVPCHPWS